VPLAGRLPYVQRLVLGPLHLRQAQFLGHIRRIGERHGSAPTPPNSTDGYRDGVRGREGSNQQHRSFRRSERAPLDLLIDCPLNRTRPDVGSTRPIDIFTVVDLPDPFGPR
jgi:hypothetical protein